MRIAILTHSTNPRGGVVHSLELGDALARLSHEAVVHAPDPRGTGFFRPTLCGTVSVPATPHGPSVCEMVEARIADYVAHFSEARNREFDVFHAHDGIGGNALADLKASGLIRDFARTVHHIDRFDDARLAELQMRAICAAGRLFTVSGLWREVLARDFGIVATIVGNGVDRRIFTPETCERDVALRARLAIEAGPVFLAVGGIEERKNTLRILEAFSLARARLPTAQLVIAGGASLLDHHAYQDLFRTRMNRVPETARAVILAGQIAQDDMPALYRIADALVFPSIKEGFGLVALEAIACGTPVVTSRIVPFTEYLGENDVVWCNPFSPPSIAEAMLDVLQPSTRRRLAAGAEALLAAHEWSRTAAAHLPVYRQLQEMIHA